MKRQDLLDAIKKAEKLIKSMPPRPELVVMHSEFAKKAFPEIGLEFDDEIKIYCYAGITIRIHDSIPADKAFFIPKPLAPILPGCIDFSCKV